MRNLAILGMIIALVGFVASCSSVSSVLSTDRGLPVAKPDDSSSRRIPLPPTVEDFQHRE